MPKVLTIGVPAHNEAGSIGVTISNLLSQEMPAGYEREIIVCDNASTDGTAGVVKKIAAKNPAVKLIQAPKRGRAHSLNAIKGEARGEIIVFCDADVRVRGIPSSKSAAPQQAVKERKRAVAKLVEFLQAHPKRDAVGAEKRPLQQELHRVGKKLRQTPLNLMLVVSKKQEPRPFVYGPFFAIKKSKVPNFPDIANLDRWLSAYLGKKRIAMHRFVEVYYRQPKKFRDLVMGDIRAQQSYRNLRKRPEFRGLNVKPFARKYTWSGPRARKLTGKEKAIGVTALKGMELFTRTIAAVRGTSTSAFRKLLSTKRRHRR